MKKKMKIGIRKEGKEVAFQDGTYSLKTIDKHMFLLDICKEKLIQISKQNTYKLKDLKIFKVLWTTY